MTSHAIESEAPTDLAPADAPEAAATSRSRQWATVAVLAFAGMGAAFMQTILIPIQAALPELLDSTADGTAWVITVTLLVAAICTPISGRLGDMYGKRRVALVLLGLLVAGSIVAAFSSSLIPLIVGRGLQGTGMGVIPLGIATLRDVLDKKRLGSAIALVSATLGVGGALGLPLSAYVTQNFDWHALFWVAAGIGVLAFVLVAVVVPATAGRPGGRLDFVGAIGLAIGLAGVLLGVTRGNDLGWTSVPTLALLIGGAIVLIAWGFYELRARNPLVDLRVNARRPVLLTNLASIAMGFALFCSSIAFPQLLVLPTRAGGMGLSLLEASFVLVPSGLAMLAMSPVAGALGRRFGAKPLLVSGAAVIALAYLAATLLELQTWEILAINAVLGIGIGLGYAAMPTLIMQSVPRHETGAANGFNTLMRALGTSVAAAVIAAIIAHSTGIEGFHLAFIIGLGAAVVCTVIAAFIPANATFEHEENSHGH